MRRVRLVVLAALPPVTYFFLLRFLGLWVFFAFVGVLLAAFLFWRAVVSARRSGQVSEPASLFIAPPVLLFFGAFVAAFFIDVRALYWFAAALSALLFMVFHESIGALKSGSVASREHFLQALMTILTAVFFLFAFAAVSSLSFLRFSAGWVALFLLGIFTVCTSLLSAAARPKEAEAPRRRLWIVLCGVVMVEWIWVLLFMPFTALTTAGCVTIVGTAMFVLMSWALQQIELTRRRLALFTAVFVAAMVGGLVVTRWV